MLEVKVNKDETLDRALSRFKKKCDDEIIKEMKKRQCYEKPSERRRKQMARARRKSQKQSSKNRK